VLGKWGALSSITVTDAAAAHEDRPAIGGIQGDGTAAASASLNMFRRKEKIHWGNIVRRPGNAFLADANIGVDAETLADSLSRRGEAPNPAAWRNALNRATVRGIRHAATSHLVGWAASTDVATGLLGLSFNALLEFQSSMLQEAMVSNPVVAASAFIMGEVAVIAASRGLGRGVVMRNFDIPPEELPLSLLPCSADRLAIFGVQSVRYRHLVHVLA
jgi:hypothetical protein